MSADATANSTSAHKFKHLFMLATGVTTQPTARSCSTSKIEVDHAEVQHALYDSSACKITLGQNGIMAWYIQVVCLNH